MYIILDEELRNKIEEITNTDYSEKDNLIPVENVRDMLDDLVYQYHVLENEFLDFKEKVEDNFKQINISEQVDINDSDFI